MKIVLWNKRYIFLFVGLFCILLSQRLLNHNGLSASIRSDGLGYYSYLPAAIIYQDFDYHFFQKKENNIKPFYHPGFNYQEEPLNKYYCGVSICLLPFFTIGILISAIAGTDINGYTDTFLMLVSLATIFYFLLSTYLMSKIARFFSVSERVNLVFCLIFFFATHLSHYVFQEPSMSHSYSFFGVTLFFYAFFSLIQKNNLKNILFTATSLGLVVLIRPTNAVIILFTPFFFDSLKSFIAFIKALFTDHFLAVLGAIGLFFALLFLQFFLYYLQVGHFFIDAYQKESFDFSNPQLLNSLFSYKGGLFLYTPIIFLLFLFILFCKGSWYKKNVFFISFGVFIYIISSWWCWWYGGSFSNRAFIDIFPLFIIIALYLYGNSMFKHKRFIFLIGLPFIFANQIMAYQYRNGFMGQTDITEEKYWDIFLNPDLKDINEKIIKRITKHGIILKKDSITFEGLLYEKNCVPEGYNSKMACVIGEKNNYSTGISFDIKNVNTSFYVYAEGMIKPSKPDSNAGLTISVEEGSDLKKWYFVPSHLFKADKDGWKKVTYVIKFEKGEISTQSVIKIHAMATQNQNIVDNLKCMLITP